MFGEPILTPLARAPGQVKADAGLVHGGGRPWVHSFDDHHRFQKKLGKDQYTFGVSITINTDGISDEQKASAKFQSTYQGMMTQLSSPGFIPVLCAHEAAHLVYFAFTGVTSYKAFPARISYDPQTDDFVGSLAGVQILDTPKFVEGQFWDQLFKIACAHAAGGVVARKLMPSTDGGDQDDKERFERLCAAFMAKDPNFSVDVLDFWKKAQDCVAKALEKPEWLSRIQTCSEQLGPNSACSPVLVCAQMNLVDIAQ